MKRPKPPAYATKKPSSMLDAEQAASIGWFRGLRVGILIAGVIWLGVIGGLAVLINWASDVLVPMP